MAEGLNIVSWGMALRAGSLLSVRFHGGKKTTKTLEIFGDATHAKIAAHWRGVSGIRTFPNVSARDNWDQEKQAVFLYGVLAEVDPSAERRALFKRLAREAESQAAIWESELRRSGGVPPGYRPSVRTRVVAGLVRRLGVARMRRVLSAMKVRGMSIFESAPPPAAPSPPSPSPSPSPARAPGVGGAAVASHPMPHRIEDIREDIGRRHRNVASAHGGTLRAAVFGVNDGLVSNASLIFGIAGATADRHIIALSGVAGLLAGAFSMAAGEYVSMRSQREMFERQIAVEREELAQYPVEEAAELAVIYEARGLPRADAERVAQAIIANPASALDTVAREELGLDPSELGSPWGAALSSFLAFAGGALIPLSPFVLPFWAAAPGTAMKVSIGLAGAALFGVGAAISLFTGRRALWAGLRMLLIGGAAATATNLIGRLFGVQ
jgi:VIT1/CCC1 family predicted Fe2+/Mn2+ transporter